jgi:hypothetical protein
MNINKTSWIKQMIIGMLMISSPVFADEIPSDLWGRYAVRGDCTRPLVVGASKNGLTIQVSGRTSAPLPVFVCRSCAGGITSDTIEVYVYPILGTTSKGDDITPVAFRFNADGHKDALQIEREEMWKVSIRPDLQEALKERSLRRCAR